MTVNYGINNNSAVSTPYKVATIQPVSEAQLFEANKNARIYELIDLEDKRPLTNYEKNELNVLTNSIDEVTVTADKYSNKNIYLAVAVGLLIFFIIKG